jgi:hypothetical protein
MPTFTTPSTNMLLPVPIVGVDPGPDYALNINNCFFFVDEHDHSPGKGLRITPSGLNINTALTFTNNPATNLSFINFNSQGSVSTLKSLYVVNNDLYFTDGNGNAFPLTASGGVAGTPGSIGSLIAPASVTYNSGTQTFIFAATATQAANIDGATFILRNTTAPFNGITLSAPLALPSSYNIVLPPLPTGTDNIVVLDSFGNLSAPWKLDYSTINVNGSNQLFANIGGGEHSWELNGDYASLAMPFNDIDAIFFAQYGITLEAIWIYSGTSAAGTPASGTTEFDLKYRTSASPIAPWVSIFSTTPKIDAVTNLTTLTSSAGLATATLANHGFVTGEFVTISGVTPTTTVTSLTRVGTTATITLVGHGFTGGWVTVAGATPAGYNGTFAITSTTSSQIQYTVPSSTLTTPATGTITITAYNGQYPVNSSTTNDFTYIVPSTMPGTPTGTPKVSTRLIEVYTDSGSLVGPQAGVIKPVLGTTAIPAGSVLRWDLLQKMSVGSNARIRMWYKKS